MGFYFDPTDVDISNVLPEGLYTAVITSADNMPTKTGGAYLGLELTITNHDKYSGRKVFDRLNYNCPTSATAEDIAKRSLKIITICKYGEARKVENEAEFIGAIVDVMVSVEHDNYKNDKVNRIKFYKIHQNKEDVAW